MLPTEESWYTVPTSPAKSIRQSKKGWDISMSDVPVFNASYTSVPWKRKTPLLLLSSMTLITTVASFEASLVSTPGTIFGWFSNKSRHNSYYTSECKILNSIIKRRPAYKM